MKSRRFLLLGALAIVLVGTSNAPSAAQSSVGGLLSEADAYLKLEMRNRGIPGLAVAVVRDGRIVATQAYGVANLELNVPVTLDTVFPIASLDKQLTASGIMLLVQDGKVRLDDEIGRYFVDPPASWKGIRVRHLLSHSSGLPDVTLELVGGLPFVVYTTQQILDNVKKQSLLFPPGTGYNYSDAGYFLCDLIIEKASGMPYWHFMTERVFTPAGVTSTVSMDPALIIKNRVAGYELTATGQIISNRRNAIDAGPLIDDVGVTVGDFARWAAALETDRIIPKTLRDQMWTPQARETAILYWRDYGFGWGLDRYLGVRVVLHSGHTGTGIVVLPEQRISVIVFTNLDDRFGTDAYGLALGIVGIYVPGISLLTMPGKSDPDPGRTERLRDEFLRLVKGEPDYSQYSRSLFSAIREGVDSFATRAPHLGALQSFSFLEVEERDGEELLYYRANFARGRLILRVGFDGEGKIVRFQVTHI